MKPASNRHGGSISHVVMPKGRHRCGGIYWVLLVIHGYDGVECALGRAPGNTHDRMAPQRHEASRSEIRGNRALAY
jgi:hypothetical protein